MKLWFESVEGLCFEGPRNSTGDEWVLTPKAFAISAQRSILGQMNRHTSIDPERVRRLLMKLGEIL